ncbi:ABC transporter ATP-binding protein [archaeon]|jgi:branched-chain amino acid transport system ATP-binding protein|nr:ABC transporter ATP-binding protein [archaeon]MBT6820010.1 ABC transporter ATP-binding protein [archaeon]MBT6955728.1 ABC transporter ATP-binding protein [archaeon]MBT7238666.1 ABC transporter ATP-binding protein [archaeon]MBT7567819.1 ABC transporter ATP-binding protein [archaeon]
MLRIQNLKKHFGGVKAVDGCSFKIQEGEITALIGPNGSGKTTIFNLISGISKADSGEVFLDRQKITNKRVDYISNLGVSRMFQHARLFSNLTVRENLLLALHQEDTKFWKNLFFGNKLEKQKMVELERISKLVGIYEFQNKLARNLSYGQKRLVGIARAILNYPKVLVLDEPVAGVNPLLRNRISKILLELKKQGETILLIEHDMNFTLKIADSVVVVDEGKVIAKGTPSEVKRNKKVLEAYLGE